MHKLMKEINIISRCASIYRSDKLQKSELSAVHLTYILTICKNPGISQDQLAKQIYINKSNVTRQLENLEKQGYVQRKQSDRDKRAILVYPTEKARRDLPKVLDIVNQWNKYLIEDFTSDEAELFKSMLEKISQKAKKYVDMKVEN